jgi:tRNA modification GTPase
MFTTADTIVAIATPPGHGGIGVVRLSGPESHRIAGMLSGRAGPFEPRHATLARIGSSGGGLDRAVVTVFTAPQSYTGEDVAEISAHGSPVVLQSIVDGAMRFGARLARPGEFTLRAFLNGRLDLVQAEAVRDLVDAVTPLQARAAFDQLEGTLTEAIGEIDRTLFDLCARLEASLDFPDEGYHFVDAGGAAAEIGGAAGRITALLADAGRGRLVRDGAQVVLAGPPNSGKSSLFNRLAGAGRAIVTDVPGTTRDLITERVDVNGVPVTLIDTAGSRTAPADAIEAEGITRAAAARRIASLVVIVLDVSRPLTDDGRSLLRETGGMPRLVLGNKCDLEPAWDRRAIDADLLPVSARTGEGIERLRDGMLAGLAAPPGRDVPAVTNLRHVDLLTRARDLLERGREAAAGGAPEEFVLADLNEARVLLEEITGSRTPEDVLARIFERFCIGK